MGRKLKQNVPKGASPLTGTKPPKKNQFGQPEGNPRSNGHWKKEDTLRTKIEKMVNEMTDEELRAVLTDPAAKLGEKRLAKLLLRIAVVEQQNIEVKPILPMEEE